MRIRLVSMSTYATGTAATSSLHVPQGSVWRPGLTRRKRFSLTSANVIKWVELRSTVVRHDVLSPTHPLHFTHPRTRSQPLNPSQMSSLLLYWSQVIPHRTECHSASESHTQRRTMVSMAQSLFNNHWRTSLFSLLRVVCVGGGTSSLLVSQQDKDGSCNIVIVVLH